MKISIIVRFSFEGFHRWPEAPMEHAYLANNHRHMFHVEGLLEVSHDDRDVEFIQLRREMKNYCSRNFEGPHTLSCERMAIEILDRFHLHTCRVLEDGENGAEVSV